MKQTGKLGSALLAVMTALCCAGCGMFRQIGESSGGTAQTDAKGSAPVGTGANQTVTGTAAGSATTTSATTTETTLPPAAPDITVNMLAVGDNLVQEGVYKAAKKWAKDGTYDFTKTYENVKPIIQAADVAIINQETLICGGDYPISGTKLNFCSPVQLGDTMVDVGFDVFTIANNHMLDRRIDGLEASINYWDGMMAKHDILALGAYRNTEDQNKIRVRETKGMKIAYLAYTEHLNGYSIPADSPIKVGITLRDEALIERQIKEAKQIADAVIVSPHWGVEDTNVVADRCKVLAKKMIGWGADVILGTHTHTAETMEYIDRPDGTRGFVFYSLGNFISAQTDNFNVVGEMGGFDLVKHGDTGKVTVENVTCMPVITHYEAQFANLRLYPYSKYTPELANSHALPYTHVYPETAKDFGMKTIDRIIENNIPAEFRKLK